MKWPIGVGFSMSVFPVRLTLQGFSLLVAHGRTADGPESFPRRKRVASAMYRKQVKPSKLPDSMNVEQPLPPSKEPSISSNPLVIWDDDDAGHWEAGDPCVAGRRALGWPR